MKILTQLAIIFTICLVAECIAAVLPFTFPSGVIGMILLFLLLLFKFIKRRHIEEVSQFVLKNISFFYIYGSIMESVGYLQGYMWQFALICIVALLTFLATAYTVIGVMKLQEKIMANKGDKMDNILSNLQAILSNGLFGITLTIVGYLIGSVVESEI